MSDYQDFEDLYKIEAGKRVIAEKRIEELEERNRVIENRPVVRNAIIERHEKLNSKMKTELRFANRRIEELEQKVIDAEHLAAERLSEMNRLSERYRDRWMEEESLATQGKADV